MSEPMSEQRSKPPQSRSLWLCLALAYAGVWTVGFGLFIRHSGQFVWRHNAVPITNRWLPEDFEVRASSYLQTVWERAAAPMFALDGLAPPHSTRFWQPAAQDLQPWLSIAWQRPFNIQGLRLPSLWPTSRASVKITCTEPSGQSRSRNLRAQSPQDSAWQPVQCPNAVHLKIEVPAGTGLYEVEVN